MESVDLVNPRSACEQHASGVIPPLSPHRLPFPRFPKVQPEGPGRRLLRGRVLHGRGHVASVAPGLPRGCGAPQTRWRGNEQKRRGF